MECSQGVKLDEAQGQIHSKEARCVCGVGTSLISPSQTVYGRC